MSISILAAVDAEQQPAQTIEVGYDLATQYGDDLVVLHVMPQDLFDRRRGERRRGGRLTDTCLVWHTHSGNQRDVE